METLFIVKLRVMSESGDLVEGYRLFDDRSEVELTQELKDFCEEVNSGEEAYYTDSECVSSISMENYKIVKLTESEFNTIDKLVGPECGIFLPEEM